MQLSNLFNAAAAACVTSITAASIARQADPHVVDLRTYGQPGCLEDNQGVYTYQESDLNICYEFPTSLTVESIFVVDILDGCFLYAYADRNCTVGQVTVPVGIQNCYNYTAGLGSHEVVC